MTAKEQAKKNFEMKEKTKLENWNRICCIRRLDISFSAEDYVTALDDLIYYAKKEVLDEVKTMVNECIEKGLHTEFILSEGIPKIEKRHLKTTPTNDVK